MKLYSNELVNASVHIDTEFTPFSKSAATRIAHTYVYLVVYFVQLLRFIFTHIFILLYYTYITLLNSRKMRRYRHIIWHIPSYTIQTGTNDVFTQRQYFRSRENLDVCVHALARTLSSCVYGKYFIPIRTTDKEKYLSH